MEWLELPLLVIWEEENVYKTTLKSCFNNNFVFYLPLIYFLNYFFFGEF